MTDDPAKFIKESTTHTLYGLLRSVVEVFSEDLKIDANELEDVIQTELQTSLDKLFQSWGNQCNTYWRPVLEIVSALPKDELAAMAEAFVNLTKFRRRITPERETVGGPIDVAVITKGDGFIWVKRKHYFDSELNPRVMARFLKEF